jgi:uracil-DNA glycosylase
MPLEMMIVGEYLSGKDVEEGGPFMSRTNYVFRGLMRQVGISPREVRFDNVVTYPGDRDSIYAYCGPKTEAKPGVKFVKRNLYMRAEHWPEVERLWERINHFQPNIVVACGDLALWALTSENSMEVARGRVHKGNAAIQGRKVLPLYSAKHVIQNHSDRFILLSDLEKARRQSKFPEIIRPRRFIHLHPTLEDLEAFLEEFIRPSPKLDVDIETKGQTITCIGFAPSPERSLVIPFYDPTKPDGNYWLSAREEYMAWQWVRRVLVMKDKAVCGQNFSYDMQYLWRTMGIPCPTFTDDTMLMHHSLFPELRKGLGFLASLYTDELPWKFMRQHAAKKTDKKEDTE